MIYDTKRKTKKKTSRFLFVLKQTMSVTMARKRPCDHFDVSSSFSHKRQRMVEPMSSTDENKIQYVEDLARRLQETETFVGKLVAQVEELNLITRKLSKKIHDLETVRQFDTAPSYIS
jgi:hypothetical protein